MTALASPKHARRSYSYTLPGDCQFPESPSSVPLAEVEEVTYKSVGQAVGISLEQHRTHAHTPRTSTRTNIMTIPQITLAGKQVGKIG